MFLGIDLGTGSVKVLVLDGAGQVVAEGSSPYQVRSPHPGWAETSPDAWWSAVCAAVSSLPEKIRHEIEGIGLSGQMHGVVLCKEGGTPLRPAVLWADARSKPQLAAYEKLSDEHLKRLANPVTVGMAGPSLLWLKENELDLYKRARWALQPKDWLRLRLTGVANAEPADASATLLYDLKQDGWLEEVVRALGLRFELLAPLVGSSQVAGTLTPEAANDLGLKQNIPVAAGGGDAACSAFGSGLVKAGQAQVNLGTAMQIFAVRDKAQVDPSLRTHLYRTVLNDTYAMAAMQNAGLALEWVRALLGVTWDEMYALAFACSPDCEGLTFLPYLTGERTPHLDPEVRGAWHGLSLKHGRSHLARAAFEGVAFALKDGLVALGDIGIDPDSLRLAGGGSLRPEWRELLADVLAKPLYAVSVPSASAKGAALLAALATEYFVVGETADLSPVPTLAAKPNPDEQLVAAYERFRRLYPVTKQLKN